MRKKTALFFILIMILTVVAPAFAQTSLVEDSWTTKAPMHQARSGLGAIAVNGMIYAIGGTLSRSDFISGVLGTNEQYDTTTDTWVYKASMPTPRAFFAVVAYQAKIYCFGGVTGERLIDATSGFYATNDSNAVEIYDTITDTWAIKPHMPKGGGMYMSAQVVDGKIYVIDPPDIYVYDPNNATWAERDNMPLLRYSAVIDNKIVATYYQDVWSPSSPYYGDTVQAIRIYDPESNNITNGSDNRAVVGQGGVGATLGVSAPQRVYVLGDSQNQAYDPKTDNWTTAAEMPTARVDLGVAVVNDTLYAIGGYILSNRAPTNVNEQYIPIGYGTPDPAYVLEHNPPQISFLSPLNQTYSNSSISITFGVNKNISGASYSLDGQHNVTIASNSTIDNIPNGSHNLTVYANDTYGNVGSRTVNFTVETPWILGSITVILVIAVAVVIIGLIIGILRYRRHQKKANS